MEKLPPQSIEAEKNVLGNIIINGDNIFKIKLQPEHFYQKNHQEIFKAMRELSNSGIKIDLMSLIEKYNGRGYLIELSQIYGTNIEYYADIIYENFLRREAIRSCHEAINNLYGEDYEDSIKPIKELFFNSIEKYRTSENPEMSDDWYDKYGTYENIKFKTGLSSLDSVIGGLSGTELMLILANTNVGKTTLLLNIAINLSLMGKKVLFFSLEMGKDELMNKIVSIVGEHNAFKIRSCEYEKDMLYQTKEHVKKLPITIVDRGAITTQDVLAETFKRKLREEVDVVMIDYIQRLSDRSTDGETQRLGRIARTLKNFALTYEVPIISPAQIDKSSAKNNETDVSSVAWSKDLANEADIALTLYEKKGERVSINEEPEKELKLIISKSRGSEKDRIFNVNFDRSSLRMTLNDDNPYIPEIDVLQLF